MQTHTTMPYSSAQADLDRFFSVKDQMKEKELNTFVSRKSGRVSVEGIHVM